MAGWATVTIVTSNSSMKTPAQTASRVHHFLSIDFLHRQAPSPAPVIMLRDLTRSNPWSSPIVPNLDANSSAPAQCTSRPTTASPGGGLDGGGLEGGLELLPTLMSSTIVTVMPPGFTVSVQATHAPTAAPP